MGSSYPQYAHLTVGTIAMMILFGTNAVLYCLFKVLTLNHKKSQKQTQQKFAAPFVGDLKSFVSLTRDVAITGSVLAFSFVCERYPLFDHGTKHYDRDLFLFVCFLFFAYAWYTREPTKDLTLLSRGQTEEWKGWMQFVFLLYHYFHAGEVYNSVRVMITCYVWMTGFGNFSFFFFRRDFGWLRVVQMLWRLNFTVVLLMLWHGNTYILYYICPLHTFYFLCTYMVMFIGRQWNHSRWPVRFKIFGFMLIIFLLWDSQLGLFDTVFSFLGRDKIIGATSGTVWEWYFRTSLDKYSAALGMIFACNYPLTEQWFSKAATAKFKLPLVIVGVVLGAATVWWMLSVYPRPKLEYNAVHSYFGIIPLLTYIFFRNITPNVRSKISMSLHALGKTTLETYLLQHHIWLSSNAKTLLTVVPGYPWLNFAITTCIFVTCAKILYRMTMNLRGMMLPDDKTIALRNMVGMLVFSICLALVSVGVWFAQPDLGGVLVAIALVLVVIVLIIRSRAPEVAGHTRFARTFKLTLGIAILISIAGVVSVATDAFDTRADYSSTLGSSASVSSRPFCQECVAPTRLSSGLWTTTSCDQASNAMTFCETGVWSWNHTAVVPSLGDQCAMCPPVIAPLSEGDLGTLFADHHVVFVGDSNLRKVYHAMNALADPSYDVGAQFNLKAHSNLKHQVKGTTIEFIWAPFLTNTTKWLRDFAKSSDIESTHAAVVMSGGLWDLLHRVKGGSAASFLSGDIAELTKAVSALQPRQLPDAKGHTLRGNLPAIIWMDPLPVVDTKLNTMEKRKYMTERHVQLFRQAVGTSALTESLSASIDPTFVCDTSMQVKSTDGVHYTLPVYDVIAQMIANACDTLFGAEMREQAQAKLDLNYKPKSAGAMDTPLLGLPIVLVSLAMLLSMDNFFGVGYLGLAVATCGNISLSWQSAYGPILESLGFVAPTTPPKPKQNGQDSDGDEESGSLLASDES